jgi:hypothetical protein
MRRFELYRYRDPSGVSGTGVVAIGLEFPPDHEGHQWIALKWLGRNPALTLWPSLYDLLEVHGHLGASDVRRLDPDPFENPVDTSQRPPRTAWSTPHDTHQRRMK